MITRCTRWLRYVCRYFVNRISFSARRKTKTKNANKLLKSVSKIGVQLVNFERIQKRICIYFFLVNRIFVCAVKNLFVETKKNLIKNEKKQFSRLYFLPRPQNTNRKLTNTSWTNFPLTFLSIFNWLQNNWKMFSEFLHRILCANMWYWSVSFCCWRVRVCICENCIKQFEALTFRVSFNDFRNFSLLLLSLFGTAFCRPLKYFFFVAGLCGIRFDTSAQSRRWKTDRKKKDFSLWSSVSCFSFSLFRRC